LKNKVLDYLIVGQGVAGSCFALKLFNQNKTFQIIDSNQNKASSVAVGIYNPVVLKRFSLIWKAEQQLQWMFHYFSDFEKLLGENFIEKLPTYRILKSEDEIQTWKKKSDLPVLENFLSKEIQTSKNQNIHAPLGFSEVKHTGRIQLEKCMRLFREFLIQKNNYRHEDFDYSELKIQSDKIIYKGIEARRIVFCEGYKLLENPYFNYLPVIGVKGEVLEIETESEIPKAIWKAHNFLMPENSKTALTASTYDREDMTYEPTENGRKQMQKYLEEIYTGNYKITDQKAGIRPTVVDRRPILGSHPAHQNLFVLNGMGTRGTLLAPQMTEYLYEHIENSAKIDKEADVRRFDKFWD
jgi:hypothetical protein